MKRARWARELRKEGKRVEINVKKGNLGQVDQQEARIVASREK